MLTGVNRRLTSPLAPAQHLAMQAALQSYVDNSISKTINAPEDCPFEAFSRVYDTAYDLGSRVTRRSGQIRSPARSSPQPKTA
jgi:ribonucleoside-diphosphate reductase alpha chain